MTIKKKFLLTTLLYFVVCAAICVHLLVIFKDNTQSALLIRELSEIEQGASRLELLTIEAFDIHEDHNHTAWLIYHKSLSEKINELASKNLIEKRISSRLNNDFYSISEKYNSLTTNYHTESLANSDTISKNKKDSVVEIFTLLKSFENELSREKVIAEKIIQKHSFFLYTSPIFLLVLTLSILLFIQKSVVFRLSTASAVIKKLTEGSSRIKIPETKKADEIGDLLQSAKRIASLTSIAFNNLKKKTDVHAGTLETTLEESENQNEVLEKTELAMLNILEDVEDEKEKAEKFADDLKKFMLAVESTSEEVFITDPDGIILYTNPAVKTTSGFSRKEAIGKKAGIKELWGGQMEKDFYETLWDTIKKKKRPFIGKIKNKTKQGREYWTETSISPILDNNEEVDFFVAIQRDVTKEIMIDKAKTEFVSLASHQLKTPLSSINWYTEMLLGGDVGKVSKKQKDYLNEVYQGNKRMIALVNALLNVSRIELGTFAVDPEPIDTIKLTRSVLKEMTQKIKIKKISLETNFDKNIPIISADPQLLRIVFQNLISNAIKYTGEKGAVKVTTQLKKRGQRFGGKTTKKDSIGLLINDSGIGIPRHQQNNIFTKLFRADNAKKSDTDGTGLGLYIVKSIIEQSGGEIWFESQPKKGTSFYALLPLEGMKEKKGTKKLV